MAEEGQEQEQDGTEGQEGDAGTAEPDWKAEAEKWKREARKHEDRAKGNSAAAERLQAAAKAAEDRAQAAVLRIASAEVRAALTGIVPDPAAVAEDLNLAKFLTADGEVDADKVAALRAKYAALAPAGPRAPAPNPAQGAGTKAPTLAEIAADAEKSGDVRGALRAKSQQLAQIRSQQG